MDNQEPARYNTTIASKIPLTERNHCTKAGSSPYVQREFQADEGNRTPSFSLEG